MFSLFPTAYSQYRPSFRPDPSFAYDDYIREQQQARKRREAQHRARLEAARAYEEQEQYARQQAARRRNFSGGFENEPHSSFIPRQWSPRDQGDLRSRMHTYPESSLEDLMQQYHNKNKTRNNEEENGVKASESSPISIPVQSAADDAKGPLVSPHSFAVRDAAARKIQGFIRPLLPRLRALHAIASISKQFSDTQEKFHVPEILDFDVTSNTDSTPPLLFTPRNAPVHGHEHSLVKLLSALDSVESHGDRRVRDARKQLVKRIERALADLDARKETIWSEVVKKASSRSESPDSGYFSVDYLEPDSQQVPGDGSAARLEEISVDSLALDSQQAPRDSPTASLGEISLEPSKADLAEKELCMDKEGLEEFSLDLSEEGAVEKDSLTNDEVCAASEDIGGQ